ncbi:hypothetical protein SC09_Contig28orf00048 [Bacillus subtilis]|uniref:Uncharacterized protein n=1 Tax=Bacillus subtilis TaxID=1423 RepID=A0A0D1KUI7_BACIU|nr:hypothetical protein SC09_Contig28orf00048 [Bacillus subtilis]
MTAEGMQLMQKRLIEKLAENKRHMLMSEIKKKISPLCRKRLHLSFC